MKKLLLVLLALSFGIYGFSQNRIIPPKALREVSVVETKAIKGSESYNNAVYSPGMKSASMLEEE